MGGCGGVTAAWQRRGRERTGVTARARVSRAGASLVSQRRPVPARLVLPAGSRLACGVCQPRWPCGGLGTAGRRPRQAQRGGSGRLAQAG